MAEIKTTEPGMSWILAPKLRASGLLAQPIGSYWVVSNWFHAELH